MSGNSFKELFDKQLANQQLLLRSAKYEDYTFKTLIGDVLPKDDISLFSYHVQQLQSEIGELLKADKRWKNFRADNFDVKNKEEEIADCFIVLMNIAIFSGINGDELFGAIKNKLDVVSIRVENECKADSDNI